MIYRVFCMFIIKMNSTELDIQIHEGCKEFLNITFDSEINISYISAFSSETHLRFINCTFNDQLNISGINDLKLVLIFHNCIFNSIDISSNSLKELRFSYIQKLTELNIYNLSCNALNISSNDTPIECNIYLDQIFVKEFINTNKLNISKGGFNLYSQVNESKDLVVNLSGSKFDNLSISGILGKYTRLDNICLNSGVIHNCQFESLTLII